MVNKYRPSNGSEGEIFKRNFCQNCEWWNEMTDPEGYKGCPIELATTKYKKESDKYPNQWRLDEDGEPTCTEFREVKNES